MASSSAGMTEPQADDEDGELCGYMYKGAPRMNDGDKRHTFSRALTRTLNYMLSAVAVTADFKRRFFVLDAQELRYYRDDSRSEYCGMVDLATVLEVRWSDRVGVPPLSIDLITDARTFAIAPALTQSRDGDAHAVHSTAHEWFNRLSAKIETSKRRGMLAKSLRGAALMRRSGGAAPTHARMSVYAPAAVQAPDATLPLGEAPAYLSHETCRVAPEGMNASMINPSLAGAGGALCSSLTPLLSHNTINAIAGKLIAGALAAPHKATFASQGHAGGHGSNAATSTALDASPLDTRTRSSSVTVAGPVQSFLDSSSAAVLYAPAVRAETRVASIALTLAHTCSVNALNAAMIHTLETSPDVARVLTGADTHNASAAAALSGVSSTARTIAAIDAASSSAGAIALSAATRAAKRARAAQAASAEAAPAVRRGSMVYASVDYSARALTSVDTHTRKDVRAAAIAAAHTHNDSHGGDASGADRSGSSWQGARTHVAALARAGVSAHAGAGRFAHTRRATRMVTRWEEISGNVPRWALSHVCAHRMKHVPGFTAVVGLTRGGNAWQDPLCTDVLSRTCGSDAHAPDGAAGHTRLRSHPGAEMDDAGMACVGLRPAVVHAGACITAALVDVGNGAAASSASSKRVKTTAVSKTAARDDDDDDDDDDAADGDADVNDWDAADAAGPNSGALDGLTQEDTCAHAAALELLSLTQGDVGGVQSDGNASPDVPYARSETPSGRPRSTKLSLTAGAAAALSTYGADDGASGGGDGLGRTLKHLRGRAAHACAVSAAAQSALTQPMETGVYLQPSARGDETALFIACTARERAHVVAMLAQARMHAQLGWSTRVGMCDMPSDVLYEHVRQRGDDPAAHTKLSRALADAYSDAPALSHTCVHMEDICECDDSDDDVCGETGAGLVARRERSKSHTHAIAYALTHGHARIRDRLHAHTAALRYVHTAPVASASAWRPFVHSTRSYTRMHALTRVWMLTQHPALNITAPPVDVVRVKPAHVAPDGPAAAHASKGAGTRRNGFLRALTSAPSSVAAHAGTDAVGGHGANDAADTDAARSRVHVEELVPVQFAPPVPAAAIPMPPASVQRCEAVWHAHTDAVMSTDGLRMGPRIWRAAVHADAHTLTHACTRARSQPHGSGSSVTSPAVGGRARSSSIGSGGRVPVDTSSASTVTPATHVMTHNATQLSRALTHVRARTDTHPQLRALGAGSMLRGAAHVRVAVDMSETAIQSSMHADAALAASLRLALLHCNDWERLRTQWDVAARTYTHIPVYDVSGFEVELPRPHTLAHANVEAWDEPATATNEPLSHTLAHLRVRTQPMLTLQLRSAAGTDTREGFRVGIESPSPSPSPFLPYVRSAPQAHVSMHARIAMAYMTGTRAATTAMRRAAPFLTHTHAGDSDDTVPPTSTRAYVETADARLYACMGVPVCASTSHGVADAGIINGWSDSRLTHGMQACTHVPRDSMTHLLAGPAAAADVRGSVCVWSDAHGCVDADVLGDVYEAALAYGSLHHVPVHTRFSDVDDPFPRVPHAADSPVLHLCPRSIYIVLSGRVRYTIPHMRAAAHVAEVGTNWKRLRTLMHARTALAALTTLRTDDAPAAPPPPPPIPSQVSHACTYGEYVDEATRGHCYVWLDVSAAACPIVLNTHTLSAGPWARSWACVTAAEPCVVLEYTPRACNRLAAQMPAVMASWTHLGAASDPYSLVGCIPCLVSALAHPHGGVPTHALVCAIASVLRPVSLSPCEPLFNVGDAGDAAYIILHGTIALSVADEETGAHTCVRVCGRGTCVGETALVRPHTRTYKATALTPVLCLRVTHASLRTILATYTRVWRSVRNSCVWRDHTQLARLPFLSFLCGGETGAHTLAPLADLFTHTVCVRPTDVQRDASAQLEAAAFAGQPVYVRPEIPEPFHVDVPTTDACATCGATCSCARSWSMKRFARAHVSGATMQALHVVASGRARVLPRAVALRVGLQVCETVSGSPGGGEDEDVQHVCAGDWIGGSTLYMSTHDVENAAIVCASSVERAGGPMGKDGQATAGTDAAGAEGDELSRDDTCVLLRLDTATLNAFISTLPHGAKRLKLWQTGSFSASSQLRVSTAAGVHDEIMRSAARSEGDGGDSGSGTASPRLGGSHTPSPLTRSRSGSLLGAGALIHAALPGVPAGVGLATGVA